MSVVFYGDPIKTDMPQRRDSKALYMGLDQEGIGVVVEAGDRHLINEELLSFFDFLVVFFWGGSLEGLAKSSNVRLMVPFGVVPVAGLILEPFEDVHRVAVVSKPGK